MLKKLSVKNIKSFKNESSLSLAPITFIYGPNSSGKSTLWKFLISLKDSLFRGSGASFLNFNRTSDFANPKTISFDPKKPSDFSLSFSGGKKFFLNNEKKQESEEIKFKFEFINTEVVEGFSDKYTETIKDLQKYIEGNKEITGDKRKELKKNIEQLLKASEPVKEVENILGKKFSEKEDKGVIITHLKIYKKEKCFAKYAIHRIDNTDTVVNQVGRSFSRDYKSKLRKNFESEVINLLKLHFKDNFKFEANVPISKNLWNEDFDGPFDESLSAKFDFIGPNGPGDIKSRSRDEEEISDLRYLFVPIEISNDKFFWEDHYNFLQFMKKLIIENPSNKNKDQKEIFRPYINERFNQNHSYYETVHHINSKDIKEIMSTWENTQKIMEASLEEFCEIMSNDFKSWIFKGSSFLPGSNFYGGQVYQIIFDDLTTRFLDSYIGEEEISKEGKEFIDKYSKFCVHSYDDQLTSLCNFSTRDLRRIRENDYNQNSRRPRGYSMNILSSILHEDPEFKETVMKLLNKLQLPFEIQTTTDVRGNISLGFSNKNISESQKGIPLEQSGNALQSILGSIVDLMRRDNETIIIEEPENKIHPKIQGNLIETITEIIENNNNKVIIETHSEHFILRIQKLIREKKIKPDLVAINYVYLDEDGQGSRVDNMYLDDKGNFSNKWRHGFFSERLDEI